MSGISEPAGTKGLLVLASLAITLLLVSSIDELTERRRDILDEFWIEPPTIGASVHVRRRPDPNCRTCENGLIQIEDVRVLARVIQGRWRVRERGPLVLDPLCSNVLKQLRIDRLGAGASNDAVPVVELLALIIGDAG
jgi:hypothetical protein